MKKLLFLALAFVCMSCSNNIEDDAMEHLKIMMKEMVFQSDKAELVNTQTIYKSDSLCIISFTLKAPNRNGVICATPMEYLYIDAIFDGNRICGESITYKDELDFLR